MSRSGDVDSKRELKVISAPASAVTKSLLQLALLHLEDGQDEEFSARHSAAHAFLVHSAGLSSEAVLVVLRYLTHVLLIQTQHVYVPYEIAPCFPRFDFGAYADDEVPFVNLNPQAVVHLLRFVHYYRGIPPDFKTEQQPDSFAAQWICLEQESLFDVVEAAQMLGVESVLSLAARHLHPYLQDRSRVALSGKSAVWPGDLDAAREGAWQPPTVLTVVADSRAFEPDEEAAAKQSRGPSSELPVVRCLLSDANGGFVFAADRCIRHATFRQPDSDEPSIATVAALSNATDADGSFAQPGPFAVGLAWDYAAHRPNSSLLFCDHASVRVLDLETRIVTTLFDANRRDMQLTSLASCASGRIVFASVYAERSGLFVTDVSRSAFSPLVAYARPPVDGALEDAHVTSPLSLCGNPDDQLGAFFIDREPSSRDGGAALIRRLRVFGDEVLRSQLAALALPRALEQLILDYLGVQGAVSTVFRTAPGSTLSALACENTRADATSAAGVAATVVYAADKANNTVLRLLVDEKSNETKGSIACGREGFNALGLTQTNRSHSNAVNKLALLLRAPRALCLSHRGLIIADAGRLLRALPSLS